MHFDSDDFVQVDTRIRYKQAYKAAGFVTNCKAEGVLTNAVIGTFAPQK